MATLATYRQQKDDWFKNSNESPLPYEERAGFTGLNYYPENEELRMVLTLDEFIDKEPIIMTTNTGDEQEYLRWGKIHFTVDDQPVSLTVYYASWGGYFVPFVDATSGSETYGAGRYLELRPLDENTFIVDFNLAYNPYCAYSENYSCPIPPAENRINVPIRAGEKAYH
jgi:uncharacterized protein (DUF1684 family)